MEMDTVRGSPTPDSTTFTSSSQMLGGQQQVTGRDGGHSPEEGNIFSPAGDREDVMDLIKCELG